jgi:hypothetical protein
MQKWEYTVTRIDHNLGTRASLNNFGLQGWELVAVVQEPREPSGKSAGESRDSSLYTQTVAYLKRPREKQISQSQIRTLPSFW